jgi:hypothetical protein
MIRKPTGTLGENGFSTQGHSPRFWLNPHDCNAIVVETSGLKVGHLDRHTAAKLTNQCKRLGFDRIEATCKAKLSGYRSHGDQAAKVNVLLDYYTKQMKRSESAEL